MCGRSTALGVEEALQTGLGLSESTPGGGMMAGWVLLVCPRILEQLARLLRVHSLSWCRAVLPERAWGPKTVGKEEGRKGGGKKDGQNPKAKPLWRQRGAALWWCLGTTWNVKRKPMNRSEHAGYEA